MSKSWKCEDCTSEYPLKEIGKTLSMIGSVLKSLETADCKIILKFLTTILPTLVPEYNETVVELKYKVIWLLGYKHGYEWKGTYIL